jgi:CHAT domain-containing protein
VRAGQEQWELAAAFYEQALALRRATGDRGGEAATLYELGRTAGELGRRDEARRSLEAALAILEETGNRWREGLARAALGQLLTDFGEPAPALSQLGRALELLRAAGDPIGESEALLALARAERAAAPSRTEALVRAALVRAALVRAEKHAAAALALLEPLRANLDSAGLRTAFLSRHGDAYELAVDLALELDRRQPGAGWAARALERSEQARARTLLDLLQQSGAGRRRGVSAALLSRQSQLLDRLNAKVEQQRLLLDRQGTKAGGDARRLAGELREVQRQLETVESDLRRQSPGRDTLALPRPLPAAAVQALLDSDTMLLEYALGTERSALWAVTRNRIESFELPAREVIENLARQVYESFSTLDPRPRDEEAAAVARLSGLLLGPVAPQLAGQRLVIVADGALHYLPFAALPRPGGSEPLLVRHEIVSLPSASALAVQRRTHAGRPKTAKTLAVLADPVFGPPDPRLPQSTDAGPASGFERLEWSRREAESIAAQAPAGETLLALGFDASRETALGRLRGYRLVHFATHGVLDSAHPELSALVLSLRGPDGRPREGMLRLPEIYNLDLDAELVVLSGCRTALGPQIRGEGLVGLARGFFAAGARRLVASLWQVQDRASAELMERFYRRLLHGPPEQRMRPAAALRAAQLELRADPERRDPYHWAAFAAYGDWR